MTTLGKILVGLTLIGAGVVVAKKAKGAPAADQGHPLGTGHTARVLASVHTHTAPSASAPLVAADDAKNGDTVTVIATGIASTEPSLSREWWRIITPGGSEGFASAIGPGGEHNLELNA